MRWEDIQETETAWLPRFGAARPPAGLRPFYFKANSEAFGRRWTWDDPRWFKYKLGLKGDDPGGCAGGS